MLNGLGTLIGSGLGVAGSIFGSIAASNAAKKAKKIYEGELDDNQKWFDRRYNEDYTQRADAQMALTQLQDRLRGMLKNSAATAAVTGGTEESLAASKAAAVKGIADATSSIATAGAKAKDAIENTYLTNKSELKGKLAELETGRAKSITDAVGGVADASGSLSEATETFLDNFKKPKVESTDTNDDILADNNLYAI